MALRCSASLWLLLVTSCVLAVCFGEIVDNQTFSDAPNQQTLPNKPFLGLSITNPEGLNDNALPQNISDVLILGPYYPYFLWLSRAGDQFAVLEPPIQLRIVAGVGFTLWVNVRYPHDTLLMPDFAPDEATVPYTEKSVGYFLGGSLRRPVLEHNVVNKNIALSYAVYKYLNFVMPWAAQYWADTMKDLELQIDNNNVDPSSPVGIGNLAALGVIRYFSTDGYNQLGDLTPDGGLINGNPYNRWNYSDYTLFTPANDAYTLTDASKWQPLVIEPVPPYGGGGVGATGAPYVQQHVTPQIGHAKRLTYKGDLSAVYSVPPPADSLDPKSAAYKAQTDLVVALSANLTEVQKLQAEHFDSKLRSLGSPFLTIILNHKIFDLQEIIWLNLVVDGAILDANSEVWGQKIKYNSVRPITAIRYLYGNSSIKAWGGPYKGTQTLTGNEYRSYIKTMQHADYPSGSACYCAAWTTALREALGTDTFDFSITFPNGTSTIEPNKQPAKDTTLYWPTLTDYNDQCQWSRVLGGVHFRAATIQADLLCTPIGKASYMRAKAAKDGTDTGPVDITSVM